MKTNIEFDSKKNTCIANKMMDQGTEFYLGATKICPICKNTIIGHPGISRKDNKTQICSNCATIEALQVFQDYIKKNKIQKENYIRKEDFKDG